MEKNRNLYRLISALVLISCMLTIAGCGLDKENPSGPGNSPGPAPGIIYDDLEALHLAFDVDRSLLPKPEYYLRIKNDLRLIRDSFPDMERVTHHPPWVAGEVLAEFTQAAIDLIEAGDYCGLDNIKDEYGDFLLQIWMKDWRWCRIEFELPYHAELMSALIAQSDDVVWACPNHYIGDGDHIYVGWPYYMFSDGWGDCPAGCIYHHYYEYYVNGDTVLLIGDFGS